MMHEPYLIVYNPEDLYWRPNRAGYTRQLIEAGLYTKEEAEEQHRSRNADIAVSLKDELARLQLNPEVVQAAMERVDQIS